MAAIGKACLPADKREIMVGEKQIFLGFEYPHPLNVFLAAHAVLLPEFRRKSRITHMTFFGNVGHTDSFLKPPVDIFRYVFYTIDFCGAYRTAVDVKACGYPLPDDTEDKPVYLCAEHNISSIQTLLGFPHTVGKNLSAMQRLSRSDIKMYLHILCVGISENCRHRRCIGRCVLKFRGVEFNPGKKNRGTVRRIYGMNG